MNIAQVLSLFVICSWLVACQPKLVSPIPVSEAQVEYLEDSLDFVHSLQLQKQISKSVQADVETKSVFSPRVGDDAADDMAVWINPDKKESSLIFGSNKKGGVIVFDLSGDEVAYYPTGSINNIDVTYGFRLGNENIDLVGCTNRTTQSIDIFRIDPKDGKLTPIPVNPPVVDTNLVDDIYGFCFYHSDKHYLFFNGKNGVLQQMEMAANSDNTIELKLVRQLTFDSQTEGLVADSYYKLLYIGEEDKGIWRVDAEPNGSNTPILIPKSGEDNPLVKFDVEGIAIFQDDSSGYLIASSQGNFSYAVFDRKTPNRYLGSFKITDSEHIDGVEETDGIEVVHLPLGKSFPKGVFIAQDGYNYDGKVLQRQNFKLVHMEKIDALFRQ